MRTSTAPASRRASSQEPAARWGWRPTAHTSTGPAASHSIGRANLDGTGVNHKFISDVRARGLAVDAFGPQPGPTPPAPEPEPAAGKRGLRLHIARLPRGVERRVTGSGCRARWGPGPVAATTSAVTAQQGKGRRLYQSHAWTVALGRRDVTLDRNKASIVVNRPLEPDASGGLLAFTIRGRPKRATFACHRRANRVTGTLKGTIRINVGDEYLKDDHRHEDARHRDGHADRSTWLPPAAVPCSRMAHRPDARTVRRTPGRHREHVARQGRPPSLQPHSRRVRAHDRHPIRTASPTPSSVTTAKRLFSATPTLSRALTVRAPGGAMSGTLRLKPTAKLKRRRFLNCLARGSSARLPESRVARSRRSTTRSAHGSSTPT